MLQIFPAVPLINYPLEMTGAASFELGFFDGDCRLRLIGPDHAAIGNQIQLH